jgi:chromate transporter
MDGPALDEPTPGPLIRVITRIGCIGGVIKQMFADPVAVALAGATAATFLSFLPRFLFINAAGRW